MVTNVKSLKRRLYSFLINFFMFKILFDRYAFFMVSFESSKPIEWPTEKRDSEETHANGLWLILENVGPPSCQFKRVDRTMLAEVREIINKKVTAVLQEVQG